MTIYAATFFTLRLWYSSAILFIADLRLCTARLDFLKWTSPR